MCDCIFFAKKTLIELFSLENWSKVYLNEKRHKQVSLERYNMRNIYPVTSLDFITYKTNNLSLEKNKSAIVSAESI